MTKGSAEMERPANLREKHSSWTEEGKAGRELQSLLVAPPQIPQPEMFRRGLGTETQTPDRVLGED